MIRISRRAIELFGLSIHWYGILIVTGMALAIGLAMRREERYGLPRETTLDIALWCLPAAIIGARLYYVIFAWDQFSSGPLWRIFNIREGGLAVYGGVIAGVLTGWIYARVKKLPFLRMVDLVAPCIPLGQAIGRWGNFLNQEAHGAPVENAALRFFPMAVQIDGAWYYATFFYESLWCALIVFLLLLGEKKRWFLWDGESFTAYVFLYALERSIVEGMRTDSLYFGPFRVSQALSVLAMLAAAIIWTVNRRKYTTVEKIKNRGE